jgi:hypothetical protein
VAAALLIYIPLGLVPVVVPGSCMDPPGLSGPAVGPWFWSLVLVPGPWLDPWTLGPLDPWTLGPLDLWTFGPLDLWTFGPVDLDPWTWTAGTIPTLTIDD